MKILKIVLCSAALVLSLSACSTKPVNQYYPNMLLATHLKSNLYSAINVGAVTLKTGNDNKLNCHLASDIPLPNHMSFTQTIKTALETQLRAANRLNLGSGNTLSLQMSKVAYDTSNGSWTLAGNAVVNGSKPIPVSNSVNFEVGTLPSTACRDTANHFNGAVSGFVTRVLSNQTVLAELNRSSEIQKKP